MIGWLGLWLVAAVAFVAGYLLRGLFAPPVDERPR